MILAYSAAVSLRIASIPNMNNHLWNSVSISLSFEMCHIRIELLNDLQSASSDGDSKTDGRKKTRIHLRSHIYLTCEESKCQCQSLYGARSNRANEWINKRPNKWRKSSSTRIHKQLPHRHIVSCTGVCLYIYWANEKRWKNGSNVDIPFNSFSQMALINRQNDSRINLGFNACRRCPKGNKCTRCGLCSCDAFCFVIFFFYSGFVLFCFALYLFILFLCWLAIFRWLFEFSRSYTSNNTHW